jgi:hypothetical protein
MRGDGVPGLPQGGLYHRPDAVRGWWADAACRFLDALAIVMRNEGRGLGTEPSFAINVLFFTELT